jgi:hypothetical protein
MGKNIGRIGACLAIFSAIVPAVAMATGLINSVGAGGIDAFTLHREPLNLTGKKIAIGQVEIGRPGKFGLDKSIYSANVKLEGVFYRDGSPQANSDIDRHAMMVASVMVGRDKNWVGVAPDARLYSTAVGAPRITGQPEECISLQHIARQNGGDVRAINLSFGEPLDRDPRPNPVLDGNALLTQCLDWSARVHGTTYIVAGNQGKGGISIPTDNYNGLNIAYASVRKGIYSKVDFANLSEEPTGTAKKIKNREVNVGNRRSISLIAPGGGLPLYSIEGKLTPTNGTSFAAPHATGTIALLQEYADRQLRSKTLLDRTQWTLDARKHQVMKAVLINSADKIQDKGNGLNLGMTRTVYNKQDRNWLESDAYRDPQIPLDYQLGAGQLHALRAFQQFSSGKRSSTTPVPARAWDYGELPENTYRDYVIEKPLKEGSFIALTLAWDRLVDLQDVNNNGEYDLGEEFRDRGLNNLDLYLMRADDDTLERHVSASISEVDSTEHIFHQIREPGRYKIRVVFRKAANIPKQAYGLAWWGATD